ncbi:C13 family peptidase [Aerosakkonemataceae cyanobacterium BLCC-F154]|uniref:C13 family peptidase n=1 Tax=Floridaenema fluviatile BLCC-F154 TaxID=3153640 RepID=A0ABV4YH95_9CYAN
MPQFSIPSLILCSLAVLTFISLQFPPKNPHNVKEKKEKPVAIAQNLENSQGKQNNLNFQPTQSFLIIGGGPEPEANEIGIEKNILYFQRTLRVMGYNPAEVPIFFANGNNQQATVSYLDNSGRQLFKIPEIPNIKGASTLSNLENAIQQLQTKKPDSVFFYFTGHGIRNPENINNNLMLLWDDEPLSVKEFSNLLDQLPPKTSFVGMMSQCYSGSFANLIYEGGNPKRPVTQRPRCGFFATVKTRPSVGCSPEINEADYEDYSSSFFAGLSGRDRTGKTVASADYNQDGRVSFTEAHAFAKIDQENVDFPLSTSEFWLQNQANKKTQETILSQPINATLVTARPEQKYVINYITKMFNLNPEKSFRENQKTTLRGKIKTEEQEAYLMRLRMELLNIGMEKKVRTSQNSQAISILERLLQCENGSWGKQ